MVAALNILTDHSLFENKLLTNEQRSQMFVFNFIFALSSLGYFVFLIVHGNLKRLNLVEANLKTEKEKLQLQEVKNKQNEILLAELQHRLKNNLSLMSSLMKLKMDRDIFNSQQKTNTEILHAIHTVALGNHLQVFNETVIQVPMKKYFEKILYDWNSSEWSLLKNRIEISIKDCSSIPVKQAIPLGLIFHEILCLFELNEGKSSGKLLVSLICNDKAKCIVRFESDSGINFIQSEKNTINLVEALMDQLDGHIDLKDKEINCTFTILDNLPIIESEVLFN